MAIEVNNLGGAVLGRRGIIPLVVREGGSHARSAGVSDYEICNQTMGRICGPYRVESERWWEFRGGLSNFDIAGLNVTDIRLSDGKVIRDNRGDELYRGNYYSLVLQIDGTARMCQRGTEAVLRPGDCTVIDSRLASMFDIGNGIHQYSFNFQAESFNNRFGRNFSVVCRRISGASGPGAVLSSMLQSIVRNAETLCGAEFSEATFQLLGAVLGGGRNCANRTEIERVPLSAREITDYVDARVQNLLLTPLDIAKHFNVSLRQLYRIAASADCTPAALIWDRRLHRAREMLSQLPYLPITEIAFSCGFKDSAHFSRSYRKTFGQTPRLARSAAARS